MPCVRCRTLLVVVLGFAALIISAASRIATAEDPPVYERMWGTHGSDPGQLGKLLSLCCDALGNIYVADSENNRIQKFDAFGALLLPWGSYGFTSGKFNAMSNVSAESQDFVYVADQGNYRIQKFTSSGDFVRKWGSYGSTAGQFLGQIAVATGPTDSDSVYVADRDHKRIQGFSSSGQFLASWSSAGSPNWDFLHPSSVAVSPDGFVYVADTGYFRISKFNALGGFVTQWGGEGKGPGQFGPRLGVATDFAGNVYVADSLNYRIQKFSSSGAFVTAWGTTASGPYQFGSHLSVAVNPDSDIFVADSDYSRVKVFYPAQRSLTVSSTGIAAVNITGTVTGATPFTSPVATNSSVTLHAPATAVRSGKTWYFVQWTIAGVTTLPGQLSVTFPVSEDASATASYKRVSRLTITGLKTTRQKRYVNYSCKAVFSNGSSKIVTRDAKWRETYSYLKFVRPGRLWVGAVPAKRICYFTAAYGGVSARFRLVVTK